jgi:hypothetical protein
MKTLSSVVVLCLVGWSGVAGAVTVEVRGPTCNLNATVNNSCTDDTHGALDIGNVPCGTTEMRGMLVGSFYWNVVSGQTNCQNYPVTAANYVFAKGSNGYIFYQYHHNHSVNSYSRTCDRCILGQVGATGQVYGAHVHAQYNQNSTRLTGWYSGYVTCGSRASCYDIMGYVTM